MKKFFITLIILVTLFTTVRDAYASNQSAIDKGLTYLRSQQKADGQIDGFSGVTDWTVMAFSANSIDIATIATESGQTLRQYLETNLPTLSSLSTDWSRRILAVTAIEANPYNFGGINLISGLENYYNNQQIGNLTAVNDDVFGLLALIAGNKNTSNNIIIDTTSFIIFHQRPDGGFSYSTDVSIDSDIDDTAAAIMGLVAAKTHGIEVPDIQSAIDKAKVYIFAHQNSDGGFAYDPNPTTSWDTTSNISTTSWVVMALSALDIRTDSHFINAQNYLLAAQQSDGSFPYQPAYPGDTFDTSFALLALADVFWPIHIFSGTILIDNPTQTLTATPTLTPTPTPTPSPANEELIDVTGTPTPIPTSEPIESATDNPLIPTPTETSLYPEGSKIYPNTSPEILIPTKTVLGAKTQILGASKKPETTMLTKILFGGGTLFILLHLGRLILRRKETEVRS